MNDSNSATSTAAAECPEAIFAFSAICRAVRAIEKNGVHSSSWMRATASA